MDPKPLSHLTDLLARLPGIGKKGASKLALHLLGRTDAEVSDLANALMELKANIKLCDICFGLTDTQPCPICADENRDHRLLCVVSSPSDVTSIEKTGAFKGVYHVLHGTLSPMDGMGPESIRLRELIHRVESEEFAEVILATSPTREGEASASYIAELLSGKGVKVTRIAHGVPMGSLLEYADEVTLTHALSGRREV